MIRHRMRLLLFTAMCGATAANGRVSARPLVQSTRDVSGPSQSEVRTTISDNPFLPQGARDPGWRFIRGPAFDGNSPELQLADQWPPGGPPVLWTRELGQGYSAFVAERGRVYTQCQTLSGQYLVCLDADSGDTIWEYHYDWPYEPAGVYPGPRATPTLANDRVFFAAPSGTVGCVAAWNGQLLWSRNVVEEFHGTGTEFGFASSPAVADDKLVVPVGGPGAAIVALDLNNGKTIWQSGDDAASYTPAYPIEWHGHKLVVGYLQNAVVIYDLATGRQVGRLGLSKGYDEHAAWPIYREPYLWISGPFQSGSQLLELTGTGDSIQLKPLWKEKTMSNDIVSSVLVDGAIFGFDVRDPQAKTHRPTRGHFRSIDLLTGREHWSNAALNYREVRVEDSHGNPSRNEADSNHTGASPRIGHASVIVADGKLILLNDTGELLLARATTERYEELGRIRILGGEIGWTPPTLHRGRLYARNQSRAVCVYLGEPELFQTTRPRTPLRAADLPQGKYYDWASVILSVEPEYAFDLPSDRWLRDWYLFSLLGAFAPALAVACAIGVVVGRNRGIRVGTIVMGAVAFLLGAAGTTAFSFWTGEFVFTWPVCLFLVFWGTMRQMGPNRTGNPNAPSPSKLLGYISLAALVLACLLYYLACRRFSLLFEWAFLVGFPAAIPFALVGSRCTKLVRFAVIAELLSMLTSFTAFYWSAVCFLWLRY